MNLSIIGTMFAVGLVTSIHCVFMCGGLVLTYAVKGAEGGPWYRKLVPHLVYQGAKIASYAIVALLLGGLVALLGHAVNITPFRNWLQVVAGIYMVLLGVSMTGKVKALRHLTPKPPKFLVDALSKNRRKANADAAEGHASLATPLTFGLLTGLMPCAPLIAAQASAMATGSPLTGAAAMVAFGLGTMPLMLVFGFASSLLSRQFQAKFQIVAAAAVLIFGLVIFNRGLMLVGSPVTFDTVRAAVIGGASPSSASAYAKGADGVVEIPITIKNTQFVPQTVNIPANTPVRFVVDRQEDNSCSAQLAIPQAKVLANLAANGVTKVDVPAMPAGSYTLTCGMGMMSGTLSVGAAPGAGAAAGGSPLLVPGALIVLIAGGYGAYLYRLRRRPAPAVAPVRGRASAKGATGAKAAKAKGGTARGTGAVRGAAASKGAPAATAAASRSFLGFEPAELVIGGAVVVAACVIGLATGGFFH